MKKVFFIHLANVRRPNRHVHPHRSPYLRTSDDRLLQMAWKKLLFSERTPYQLVEIYSTLDFGNVLVLDGFTNLAESDLVYTHSLMCKGVQVTEEKENMG